MTVYMCARFRERRKKEIGHGESEREVEKKERREGERQTKDVNLFG